MKQVLLLGTSLLLMACKASFSPTVSGLITVTEPTEIDVATEASSGKTTATWTVEATKTASSVTVATATQGPTEAAKSTPTLTPVPVPTSPSMLWSADMETGDLAQWYLPDLIGGENNGGGLFNIGSGKVAITDKVAHSGRYSAELTIDNGDGVPQAVRLFRWRENPAAAYYNVWYLFPQVYRPAEWWNVLQFLSEGDDLHATMWVLNVGNRPTGEMYLYLYDWQRKKTYSQDLATIPVGRWTHVQVFYSRSSTDTGRISVWQDGLRLFDLQGVQTANSQKVKWSVDNYTDQISPSPVTIYADDVATSAERIEQ